LPENHKVYPDFIVAARRDQCVETAAYKRYSVHLDRLRDARHYLPLDDCDIPPHVAALVQPIGNRQPAPRNSCHPASGARAAPLALFPSVAASVDSLIFDILGDWE
jgi:hypothetical protein